jgi:hypothetical protein
MKMKKRISVSILGIVLLMGAAVPSRAGIVTNTTVPLGMGVAIPCTGDAVFLTGNLHVLITSETSASGNTQVTTHFQPQDLSGVSLMGIRYQGTGVTQQTMTTTSMTFDGTRVNNFRIIGQGPGNDLKVHATIHLTVVNGIPTANVVNTSTTCG